MEGCFLMSQYFFFVMIPIVFQIFPKGKKKFLNEKNSYENV